MRALRNVDVHCPAHAVSIVRVWCLSPMLSLLVQDVIQQVEAENQEKAQLGTGKTYDRSIP